MVPLERALAIASSYWNSSVKDPSDLFTASYVELLEERDFWVIRGNSKAFVEDGEFGRHAIGIACFLVDSTTGELFIVGSGQRDHDVIADIRNKRAAAGRSYVLRSAYAQADREALVAIRGIVTCGLSVARDLLIGPGQNWFTGTKRDLESLRDYLFSQGLRSEIRLVDDAAGLIEAGGGETSAIQLWQTQIDRVYNQ